MRPILSIYVAKQTCQSWVGFLYGASYVLGNDTGPVFLAAKTGAPTLMMMGPDTDPAMSAPTGIAASWLRATPISGITVTAALASLYNLCASAKS